MHLEFARALCANCTVIIIETSVWALALIHVHTSLRTFFGKLFGNWFWNCVVDLMSILFVNCGPIADRFKDL